MTWPLNLSIALFVFAVLVIGIAGTKLAGAADDLADETGLGEALFGALFLGATTSLSGSVMSVISASHGHPQLAISNAIGGIGAQTAFLAIADMAYRPANLEHAAASAANLMQGALLIVLLAIPLLAMTGPDISIFSIHAATPFIIVAYIFGLRIISQAGDSPMWHPLRTGDTSIEQSPNARRDRRQLRKLWLKFVILMILVGASGWVLARSGVSIANHTGLSESLIGTLFTAVSTSLPELVTSVAAVSRGALTLAVSNIIGGNAFDVLMFPMSDIAFRGGSIYHALSMTQFFWIALSLLLIGILLMGLLRRERHGVANIGLESVLVVILYLGGLTVLVLGR